MNRIATILLVLMVAALAVLLFFRTGPGPVTGFGTADVARQPETALQTTETLLQQVRDGMTAAEQAREMLNTIIDTATDPVVILEARRRLAALEQELGNHQTARELLSAALGSDPESPQAPRLLMELGAISHRQLDQPAQALVTYRRLLSLYPDSDEAPEALIRSARLSRQLERDTCEEDIHDLRTLSQRRPEHPLADEALFLAATLAAGAGAQELENDLRGELLQRYPHSPLNVQTPDTSGQETDNEQHTTTD